MKHDFENCPGAICESDITPRWKKNVLWYPGESVCTRRPYSHAQKVQNRLNKLLKAKKLKKPYSCWTWEMLNRRTAVHPGTYGINPNENVRTKRPVR